MIIVTFKLSCVDLTVGLSWALVTTVLAEDEAFNVTLRVHAKLVPNTELLFPSCTDQGNHTSSAGKEHVLTD